MPLAFPNRLLLSALAVMVFFVSCCEKDPPIEADLLPMEIEVPAHFRAIEIPANNELTPAKVALGKRLFFDPILSIDSTVSCGSCHIASSAFADPRRFSLGFEGRKSTRQSMAIMNLAYARSLFWDGRSTTLESQVIDPILNPLEMANDTATVMARLENHPYYKEEFKRVFGDPVLRFSQVEMAIANFERTMVSANSKYDKFVAAGFDSTLFTPAEWRGYKLYFTEEIGVNHAECFHCHGGFNLDETTGAFRSNGLDQFYDDLGRANVTQNNKDIGKFKVPSLRNIEYSAPYMHDGRFNTLEEVVAHYASGGQKNVNQDPLINNIRLTEQEQADVVAFLKTFSDPDFITNPEFQP
ncbi:MAG: c-type cytochrome [Bacteroidia bacterium]|nr:c-type cytochrome [Bacteroidia bacterium]